MPHFEFTKTRSPKTPTCQACWTYPAWSMQIVQRRSHKIFWSYRLQYNFYLLNSLQYLHAHNLNYRQVYNTRRTLVGNQTVDHSDVVGASPVGAAPTISSFSIEHLASSYWTKTTASRYEKRLSFGDFVRLVLEILRYVTIWNRFNPCVIVPHIQMSSNYCTLNFWVG